MTKEISKIFESSVNEAKKFAQSILDIFFRFGGKRFVAETEVRGSEEIEEAKRKLETLPEAKTVEVKLEKRGDFPGPDLSGKLTGETIPMKPKAPVLPEPPGTKWSKLQGVFNRLRSGDNGESTRAYGDLGIKLDGTTVKLTGVDPAMIRKGEREKAQELKDQVLEIFGRGQGGTREKAVREAERTSGRKLSEEERAKVEKLSDLSWKMDYRAGAFLGDPAIQSNELTSRGGFSGGAVKPDPEKIALEACNYNKRQAEAAEKIMRYLEELGRS